MSFFIAIRNISYTQKYKRLYIYTSYNQKNITLICVRVSRHVQFGTLWASNGVLQKTKRPCQGEVLMLCAMGRKLQEWKWRRSTAKNAVFKLSTFLPRPGFMLPCTPTQLRLKTGTAHTQTELLGDPTPASSDADKRSSCARICSLVHCFDAD